MARSRKDVVAELEKLEVQFNPEDTVKNLSVLLKSAKEGATQAEKDAKDEGGVEVGDATGARQITKVDVRDAGGNFIRTYSLGEHGKKYQDLAKQFISKKGRVGYTMHKR